MEASSRIRAPFWICVKTGTGQSQVALIMIFAMRAWREAGIGGASGNISAKPEMAASAGAPVTNLNGRLSRHLNAGASVRVSFFPQAQSGQAFMGCVGGQALKGGLRGLKERTNF